MIETERLILRQWRDSDIAPYCQLNADPQVMRYFPALQCEQESRAQAERAQRYIENHGYGFWALELKASQEFLGFVGLLAQSKESGLPNTPFVEIGWRLDSKHWGKGYAPEAAQAALAFAFTELKLEQVYSFTALPNLPSQRVMSKIGMTNTGQDFDHPKLTKGHRLERHCLYRITREQWLNR